MYKYSRFLYSMEVLPIYQKIDLFFLQCYTIICVKNSQSSRVLCPPRTSAQLGFPPRHWRRMARSARCESDMARSSIAHPRSPAAWGALSGTPVSLPASLRLLLVGWKHAVRILCLQQIFHFLSGEGTRSPQPVLEHVWAATSWWVRARIGPRQPPWGGSSHQCSSLPGWRQNQWWDLEEVFSIGTGWKATSLPWPGGGLSCIGCELNVLYSTSRSAAEGADEGLASFWPEGPVDAGLPQHKQGRENECLWSLGGCWTRFLLSLVRAGQLPLGGECYEQHGWTPMAAD